MERDSYDGINTHLTTRAQTDAFKDEHAVSTTPQIFIGGCRIGGYTELRGELGNSPADSDAVRYPPIIAIFAVALGLAMTLPITASVRPRPCEPANGSFLMPMLSVSGSRCCDLYG